MPLCHRLVLATILLGAVGCPAQEQAAVDRTDPQAVTAAYMAALDAADPKAAAGLIAGDEEFKKALLEVIQDMAGDVGREGMTFQTMLTEIAFLVV